jgi:hypothetical protein
VVTEPLQNYKNQKNLHVCVYLAASERPHPKRKPTKKEQNPKKKKKTFFIVSVFSASAPGRQGKSVFLLQAKPREKVETAMGGVCHHAFPLAYEQSRKQ